MPTLTTTLFSARETFHSKCDAIPQLLLSKNTQLKKSEVIVVKCISTFRRLA